MSCLRFVYDIPSSTSNQLKQFMSSSDNFESDFNLLFTFYSLPNVILPLFGGCLVDKYGSSMCLFLSSVICLFGNMIYTFGLTLECWNIMFLGRAIFGCGGEFTIVSLSAVLVKWFSGKELSLSFSLSTCIGYTGSITNDWVSPLISNHFSVLTANWLGLVVSGISLSSSAFLYYFVDNETPKLVKEALITKTPILYGSVNVERKDEDIENFPVSNPTDGPSMDSTSLPRLPSAQPSMTPNDPIKPPKKPKLLEFHLIFWVLAATAFLSYGIVLPFNNIASDLILEKYFFTQPPSECSLLLPNQCTSGYMAEEYNPSLNVNSDECLLDGFTAPLLPMSVNVTTQYSETWKKESYVFDRLSHEDIDCNDPFWAEACVRDYCDALKQSSKTAVKFISIPYIATAITLPIFGFIIDFAGCRALMILLAFSFFFSTHYCIEFTNISPNVTLVAQGVGYALSGASLWPSVALVVEPHLNGLAYGIITASYNISLSVFPIIISNLYEYFGSRFIPGVEIFFVMLSLIGVVTGIFVNVLDRNIGNRLNRK